MIGFSADLFRFVWALFYWNMRKTGYRLRKNRGASCPCQNPSDSGLARETGCDAALSWNGPSRFRHVCPLLKPTLSGQLLCSVNAQEVRPFWRRAVAIGMAGLLGLYLCGGLSFFVVQRSLGKPLSLRQTLWPPAWQEYTQVESRYFLQKAQLALANGNTSEAVMTLSLAHQLDPSNYPAGLALARLCQTSQPELSDQLYAQLAAAHPDKRSATLVMWYQALLTRGDFKAIRSFAAEALKNDRPDNAGSWLHAFLFARRCAPDASALENLITDPNVPADARTLLQLEQQIQSLPAAEARAALLRAPSTAYSYINYYRVSGLINLGFPEDALGLMATLGSRLGGQDRRALWLDAHATMGWTDIARREAVDLVGTNPGAAEIFVLAANLIRHPDPELAHLVFARLRQSPAPRSEADFSLHVALLCLAGVNQDSGALNETAATIRAISGSRFRTLDTILAFFRTAPLDARIETILPALQPQPIEITYALLQHFHLKAPSRNSRQPRP